MSVYYTKRDNKTSKITEKNTRYSTESGTNSVITLQYRFPDHM